MMLKIIPSEQLFDYQTTSPQKELKKFSSGSLGAIATIFTQNVLRQCIDIFIPVPKYAARFFENMNEETRKIVVTHIAFMAPIEEELLYRYFVQDVLLKQKLGQYLPLEGRVGTAFRIALTTVLFAAAHIRDDLPLTITSQIHAIFTIPGGIVMGLFKESSLGLGGAIGCHMAHNILTLIFKRYW